MISLIFVCFLIMVYIQCSVCGDGICGDDESKKSCPKDCDENSCSNIFNVLSTGCLGQCWIKKFTNVSGIEREYFMKLPQGGWKNGTIIFMHGGGGSDTNICFPLPKEKFWYLNDILRGVPLVKFGEMAVLEGYAVFSLNSAYNRGTDDKERPIGKRWESLEEEGHENHDLLFINQMITSIIPSMRPSGSKDSIFVTGISNGGFMTTFASTTFNMNVTAFAPVSSGDPYGTYLEVDGVKIRKCAYGSWRNIEPPHNTINKENACNSSGQYPNELPWPKKVSSSITFKQFYHEQDLLVQHSCIEKIRDLLVSHDYTDDGAYIINTGGKRKLENHFWQEEYNQRILDFFFSVSNK